MPRRDVIRASLEGRGALILTRSMEEACAISNRIAPEHLEVSSSSDPHRWEPLLRHAGAIFLGALHQRESRRLLRRAEPRAADLGHRALLVAAGRVRLPVKRSSLIEVSEARRRHALGPIAAELAYGEGLQAHARAAETAADGAGDTAAATAAAGGLLSCARWTADNVLTGWCKLASEPPSSVALGRARSPTSLAQAAYKPARPAARPDLRR